MSPVSPAANPFQVFPDNYISTSKKGSILLVGYYMETNFLPSAHFFGLCPEIGMLRHAPAKKYGNADY